MEEMMWIQWKINERKNNDVRPKPFKKHLRTGEKWE